ncbi:MAG: LysR family transcriptional regulator [Salaquimonas sp.]|jgi:DNA-binding transcriptional LysR family regulator|nr:LysR family transcriptional regulator [Salaquimonas sp.]
MEQFDWNLLKSFLGVLNAGSLSAAARQLHISQPTLGRHVSELEDALGVTLFERGRDGLTPTQAALAIAEHARSVADATGAVALAAAGRAKDVTGTVRITASDIVATYVMPRIIADLLAEMPGLEVELVPSNDIENLLRRDADIAVRMMRPVQLDLVARKMGDIAAATYAHRDYLERAGKIPTGPDDLAGHVVIGYDRSDLVIRGFRQGGMEVDRHFFRFRCDGQVACWKALLAGVGIGFAPRYLARGHNELVELAADFEISPLPMWLVTHRELRTSARIRAVYDFLADRLTSFAAS